jgi:hypothetical protein
MVSIQKREAILCVLILVSVGAWWFDRSSLESLRMVTSDNSGLKRRISVVEGLLDEVKRTGSLRGHPNFPGFPKSPYRLAEIAESSGVDSLQPDVK